MKFSAYAAPERWLCRSPPLGMASRNPRRSSGSLRAASNRALVRDSSPVDDLVGTLASAAGSGGAESFVTVGYLDLSCASAENNTTTQASAKAKLFLSFIGNDCS